VAVDLGEITNFAERSGSSCRAENGPLPKADEGSGHSPAAPLRHRVASSADVAGEVEPLVVGQTAPDAVRLAGDDRRGEALDADLAHQADRLGLGRVLAGLGVEQFGVGLCAERDLLPVADGFITASSANRSARRAMSVLIGSVLPIRGVMWSVLARGSLSTTRRSRLDGGCVQGTSGSRPQALLPRSSSSCRFKFAMRAEQGFDVLSAWSEASSRGLIRPLPAFRRPPNPPPRPLRCSAARRRPSPRSPSRAR
jgi:hypothetical protein